MPRAKERKWPSSSYSESLAATVTVLKFYDIITIMTNRGYANNNISNRNMNNAAMCKICLVASMYPIRCICGLVHIGILYILEKKIV